MILFGRALGLLVLPFFPVLLLVDRLHYPAAKHRARCVWQAWLDSFWRIR